MDNLIKDLESNIQEEVTAVKTIKLSRGHIAVHAWSATEAVVLDTDGVHASITALATVQNISTGITNPACARNVTITCAKGGSSAMSGDVVITGTDIFDQSITDTIAEGADGTFQGVKAFKTITNILVPVRVAADDAITVGWGNLLGLSMLLSYKDQLIQCSHTDAIEATRATVTVSSSVISLNTIVLNTALNGHAVNAYIIIY